MAVDDVALAPVTKRTPAEDAAAEKAEKRGTPSQAQGKGLNLGGSPTPKKSAGTPVPPTPSQTGEATPQKRLLETPVQPAEEAGDELADAEVAAINAKADTLPKLSRTVSTKEEADLITSQLSSGVKFAFNAFTGGPNRWMRSKTRLQRIQAREAKERKRNLSDCEVPPTGKHPMNIGALDLLRATMKRAALPAYKGRARFKKHLLSTRAVKVLEHAFWHVHIALNGMGSEHADEAILDDLSVVFVEYFWAIPDPRERDYFLEHFPCIVSAAIIHAYAVTFPASSSKTSATPFRAQVNREIRHIFTGSLDDERMALAHAKRLRLDGPPPGTTESAIAELTRGMGDSGLDDEEARIAASGGDLLTGVPGIVVPPTGDLIPPGAQVIHIKSLPRPPRVWFDAGAMSPLVKRYKALAGSGSNAGPLSMRVRRSTPVPGCIVGGESTFKATPDRRNEQAHITERWTTISRSTSRMSRELSELRREEQRELEEESSGVLVHGRRSNEVTNLAKSLTMAKLEGNAKLGKRPAAA